MSRYSEFFLGSTSDIVQLELLEVSHPAFTQVYRVVRNAAQGVTVTLEPEAPGNSASATFAYYPLQITRSDTKDDLDSGLKIQVGDLGEVLPKEIDAVARAGLFQTKPTVIYRTYRSDDLSAPLYGPLFLNVAEISFDKNGATFEAKAPSLNVAQTGEVYYLRRFPFLEGFL